MKRTRVLVITCSTRPGALGPAISTWLRGALDLRAGQLDAELVPVSLSELDLPFLDEEEEPQTGIYSHDHTRRWSAMVDGADGFIVVTPEYNYGMPATLKNALDYLGREWWWKPVGFVSYGNTSAGTRSVQHAKQVVTTLRLVPLGSTVAIRISEATEAGAVRPDPARDRAAIGVLDELVRLSQALRPMRERARFAHSPGPLPGSYTRPLHPADAPDVTVLQRCCWVQEALVNDSLSTPALHESVEDVRGWLSTWRVIGLWQDGRLIGMVRARQTDRDWHIGRLAVAPDLQGRGLGRWLLREGERLADTPGGRLVLVTGAASAHNIALYTSEGYHLVPQAAGDTVQLVKDIAVAAPVSQSRIA